MNKRRLLLTLLAAALPCAAPAKPIGTTNPNGASPTSSYVSLPPGDTRESVRKRLEQNLKFGSDRSDLTSLRKEGKAIRSQENHLSGHISRQELILLNKELYEVGKNL